MQHTEPYETCQHTQRNDDDDGRRRRKNLKSTLFAWNEYNKFVVVEITNLIEAHGLPVWWCWCGAWNLYFIEVAHKKTLCARCSIVYGAVCFARKKTRGEEEEDGEEEKKSKS